jgi:hypothetical protein
MIYHQKNWGEDRRECYGPKLASVRVERNTGPQAQEYDNGSRCVGFPLALYLSMIEPTLEVLYFSRLHCLDSSLSAT